MPCIKFYLKIQLLLFLILALSIHAKAQSSKIDSIYPIDIQCKACLDTCHSTISIFKCEGMARTAWDKEVNRYYKLLLEKTSSPAKSKLKTAQKDWQDYRDDEMKFSDQMYGDKNGAAYQLINAKRLTEIVRQRALELKKYYEHLME